MANIRVDLDFPIIDGSEAVFIAPCDCSDIAGLVVYYPSTIGANATTRSKEFIFKDAHGSDLSGMDHLFKTGVYVKVLLNVTEGIAYIQNADTNSYIEGKFSGIVIAVNTSKWVKQDDGTYTNTVAAEQIVEGDLLDASLYGEYTEEQAEAFDFLIESIEAQNGKVVFTASEKIEVSLSILLRGRVNMEEKNVFVHDLKAASIEYDNTKSGLKATNPQDAIDELVTSINGLVVVVTTDGWNTQDDGTFRKIIPVEQITGNETFDISLYPGDIPTEEQVVAFSEHVTSIETSEGAIILTASEEINVQFRIFLCGKINFDNNVVLMKEYSAVDIAFDDTVAKLGAKNIQEADVALALRPVNNNILINSNFANPVNQRGVTAETWTNSSNNSTTYGLDRWTVSDCIVSSISDGLVIAGKNLETASSDLTQRIEYGVEDGKTYSLSVFVDGKVMSGTTVAKSDSTICEAYEDELIRMFLYYSTVTNCYIFYLRFKDATVHTIKWAKLELGEVATPYVPRLYAEELQLCMRYYQIAYMVRSKMYAFTASEFAVSYPLRTHMRIAPTVDFSQCVMLVNGNRANIDTRADGFSFILVGADYDNHIALTARKNSHGITPNDYPQVGGIMILDAEL